MVTAPTRSFSQSASVLGAFSITRPLGSMSVLTESKMKSDAGSIMYCISSLTDTTGFMSPQRAGACGGAAAGAGAGFWDEHADIRPAAITQRVEAMRY